MKKVMLCFALVGLFVATNASTSAKEVNDSFIELPDTCGDLGDQVYDDARAEGANHRTARAIRRQFVRNCRAAVISEF